MSTAKRIISGTAASWLRIFITVMYQIAIVPIFLSRWSVEAYAVWIALQSLISLLTTFDVGYQNFLGYEFLKIGKDDNKLLGQYLGSAIIVAVLLGLFEILIAVIILKFDFFLNLLNASALDKSLIYQSQIVFLLLIISWLINSSIGGILVRILSPFGYYPRMSWWGVATSILNSLAPTIAVMLGAGLLEAGIVLVLSTTVLNVFQYTDMLNLLKKEGVPMKFNKLKLGFVNLLSSVVLSIKSILENLRQQGIRVILAPLAGLSTLAAFSTMRTGANMALQGLNTLVNPMEPELMRFLHNRDQERMEAAFSTIWVVVIAVLSPAIVLLQAFFGPFFEIWTHGKIEFNPSLFGLLSLDVLVYALAQPAIGVVIGNNLLKPQFLLSLISAVVVIMLMWLFIPSFGISLAGISLLIAEIIIAIGYWYTACLWLKKNGLVWPKKSFNIAVTSVTIAMVSILFIILFGQLKWIIICSSLILSYFNAYRYWKSLPSIASNYVKQSASKIPVIRNLPLFRTL